jgi:hypothetical protein
LVGDLSIKPEPEGQIVGEYDECDLNGDNEETAVSEDIVHHGDLSD